MKSRDGFLLLACWFCFSEPCAAQTSPDALAERALDKVRAQITEATGRGEGSSWATQPGAISVFLTSGVPRSVYKLYSSGQMVVEGRANLSNDVPNDWNEAAERFVDLNAPVIEEGLLRFPIVDPRSDAEGFSYEEAVAGVNRSSSDLARLPMPVLWIYVLKDGTEGWLDRFGRFVGLTLPTKENPIVGRYGFWTDDNTSRINVNTASEGVYWDTPWVNTVEDQSYAEFQPAWGEYQRYPGHPARVSLSSVVHPGKRYPVPGTASAMEVLTLEETQEIWRAGRGISSTGGSLGGTERIDLEASLALGYPERSGVTYNTSEALSAAFTGERAERVRRGSFFLTTENRSDDTTLAGYPRISMWPTMTDPGDRLQYDKGMLEASTVRREEFGVFRNVASSVHNEAYGQASGQLTSLSEYLRELTSRTTPGFGNSFGEKYGFGRFDDREQLAASSFGYIRSTNLAASGRGFYGQTTLDTARGFGQIHPYCFCGGTGPHQSRWHVANAQFSFGPGRMLTLSEVSLVTVVRAEVRAGTAGGEPILLGSAEDIAQFGLQPGDKLVEVGLLVEGFAPQQGVAPLQSDLSLKMFGPKGDGPVVSEFPPPAPESFTLAGQHLTIRSREEPDNTTWETATSLKRPEGLIPWGGSSGVRLFSDILAFEPIVVNSQAETLGFGGSSPEAPLRIFLTSRGSTQVLQSFRLAFPAAELPAPNWWTPFDSDTQENSLDQRLSESMGEGPDKLINAEHDVVQSLVVPHGDYRLISGKRVLDERDFVPHPRYGKARMAHSLVDAGQSMPGATFGRELVIGAGYSPTVRPDFPVSPGTAAYGPDNNDPAETGDWDSGVGIAPDGAYTNKSDDGDVRGLTTGGVPYFEGLGERYVRSWANHISHRMALPGFLGSLPTGARSNVPWRTLLLRPAPRSGHFGAELLPDHLWLDNFRLPVVGPWLNSDGFSTDGKTNLNYRIAPFGYIHRATALHAVMKSEKFLAIPTEAGAIYKTRTTASGWRHYIDAEETLNQWEEKFDRGEKFRSESEICEQYLVPEGMAWDRTAMEDFWSAHALTGDNVRERPYASLHGMLTTRSNSFEVFVVAESLEKSQGSDPEVFDSAQDRVVRRWQGSGRVQRRVDPQDSSIDMPLRAARRSNLEEHPDLPYRVEGSLLREISPPFEITEVTYNAEAETLTLIWNSSPGEHYAIETSQGLTSNWNREDAPEIVGHPFYRGVPSAGYQTRFTLPVTRTQGPTLYRIVQSQ